jgi:hypothetical protein
MARIAEARTIVAQLKQLLAARLTALNQHGDGGGGGGGDGGGGGGDDDDVYGAPG